MKKNIEDLTYPCCNYDVKMREDREIVKIYICYYCLQFQLFNCWKNLNAFVHHNIKHLPTIAQFLDHGVQEDLLIPTSTEYIHFKRNVGYSICTIELETARIYWDQEHLHEIANALLFNSIERVYNNVYIDNRVLETFPVEYSKYHIHPHNINLIIGFLNK